MTCQKCGFYHDEHEECADCGEPYTPCGQKCRWPFPPEAEECRLCQIAKAKPFTAPRVRDNSCPRGGTCE